MYNLKDFVPFTGQYITEHTPVLLWTKQNGYYFTSMGYVTGLQLIVAIKV